MGPPEPWRVRLGLALTLSSASLAVQWLLLAFAQPNKAAISDALRNLGVEKQATVEAAAEAAASIRTTNMWATGIAVAITLASLLLWVPTVRGARGRDTFTWPNLRWAIALAIPACAAVFYVTASLADLASR